MDKNKWDNKFKKMFHLKKIKNSCYYNNPNVCKTFTYEKINPDHIGLVWGRRKNKTNNWIKVCKVTISNIFIYIGGIFERAFMWLGYILNDVGVLHFCLYICLGIFFLGFILYIPSGGKIIHA